MSRRQAEPTATTPVLDQLRIEEAALARRRAEAECKLREEQHQAQIDATREGIDKAEADHEQATAIVASLRDILAKQRAAVPATVRMFSECSPDELPELLDQYRETTAHLAVVEGVYQLQQARPQQLTAHVRALRSRLAELERQEVEQ